MKITAAVWTCVFLLFVAAARPQDHLSLQVEDDELVKKARWFLTALENGDFEAAIRDFDETMLQVSGPEKLAAFWEDVPGRFGAFKNQTGARRDKLGQYDVALVTCEFEKVTLDARIVFDKAGRIAGFQFIPSLPPAIYEVPDYADPASFEEEEVAIGSEEWRLPGTLSVPNGDGPFPALVLVHGSGPNDRDETLGPNKPFKDIAWGLASRGIAVLRYDKRTYVYGPKMVADRDLRASLTVKEESIDDALHGVAFLEERDKVDASGIFVLGHSLGGYLVPRIAAAGKGRDVAGFIVMAGLTRPLEETVIKQMQYLLALDGALSEEDKKQLKDLEDQAAKIQGLDPSDIDPKVRLMNAGATYWLDLRGYKPSEMARSIVQPMLILQGKRDYQVTTEDFENWKKSLGERADVEFQLYDKLNHLFFEGQGFPTPQEYLQIHGNVARYVIEDMAAWIKKVVDVLK